MPGLLSRCQDFSGSRPDQDGGNKLGTIGHCARRQSPGSVYACGTQFSIAAERPASSLSHDVGLEPNGLLSNHEDLQANARAHDSLVFGDLHKGEAHAREHSKRMQLDSEGDSGVTRGEHSKVKD
jgi:hypothetical protein